MIAYHGSTEIIANPDITYSKKYLDLKRHMRWNMENNKDLEEIYKQNLENDIINTISKVKQINLQAAFNAYYTSKLAEQISKGSYGIDNMDAKYLAQDLIECEHELFK